ncbi:hypothetical protein Taro_043037 [Colocasia esculenta]|uniref:Uncharacterized protein n=1 Tax=Colocasia esculenta TaxID=4460 RepID=A0A843WUJ3_COLES|nr:hypothetical protein [Colocasia esculenta]
MIMELGARRRWPFRREGPNKLALLLEVGTLDSSFPSMLPSPLEIVVSPWFGVRLLSSGRARIGQRRQGSSRHPRS